MGRDTDVDRYRDIDVEIDRDRLESGEQTDRDSGE
jgi:hypothetical protein